MYHTKSLDTDHKDVIHDIAFDYYGRRMATCSSDQAVKIWNLDDDNNWVLSGSLKSHTGAVWKVTWAHPEFGQIMAICSFDRSATVYQETVTETSSGMQTTWTKQHTLMDARSYVTDIKFAPKCMGLMLATCSADGLIRIYRAYDVMNLSQWTLMNDISTRLPCCSCLTWNPSPSRFSPPMLAVGSEDSSVGNTTTAATASHGAGSARVAVFTYSEAGGKWDQIETLSTIKDAVYDIAFAPNPGRSFHTLAIASKDLKIVVLKSKPGAGEGSSAYDAQLAGQFSDHGNNVWRVSWNLTGTVLTASGDNGLVKLYKANYLDTWKCVGSLNSSSSLVTSGESEDTPSALSFAAVASKNSTANARYLKMASTANPTHVPWH